MALFSFNMVTQNTKPLAYSDKISQVFSHPFDALAHENLAQVLWSSGAQLRAAHERTLAAEISPVLGASTSAKEEQKKKEAIYWQNIIAVHPDYRDAYVQLAQISYNQGNITDAHTYLMRAQNIDPNNKDINALVDFTSNLVD